MRAALDAIRPSLLVLVDTDVVARAPPQYIVQGMGDALAAALAAGYLPPALRSGAAAVASWLPALSGALERSQEAVQQAIRIRPGTRMMPPAP